MYKDPAHKYRDIRYSAFRPLVEHGMINRYEQIFEYVPKSIIARDLGFNSKRINKLIHHPLEWRLRDLILLSKLLDVDDALLYKWIVEDRQRKK